MTPSAPGVPAPRLVRRLALSLLLTLLLSLGGCTTIDTAPLEELSRAAKHDEALRGAEALRRRHGDQAEVRAAESRVRDRGAAHHLARAELALATGRLDEAAAELERARRFDVQRSASALLAGRLELARAERQRALQAAQGDRPAPTAPAPATLGASFQRPVTLEFRDAPLRQVFEALARSSGVNFAFDKDVRAEVRLTLFLRQVTLDEAMRLILATQQLDRKVLNDSTVLIYPNTPAKQREHQELVTRTFYLANTDVKQAQALVRTLAKTRDTHVDERLNALVVRDTPEVVRQIEQLVASLDLPEPEVMLAVEVMEVASDRVDALGVDWPTGIAYGVAGAGANVPIGGGGFRGLVGNPALIATLRGDAGSTNLLANPIIRARQREKAKVQIGEKLPVFTTTSTANVGVSTSVTYLDVGLKLDVEPSVLLDGEVVIKVGLEVSNLVREVSGPQGALAYQVGSRTTTTSLRLRDGQTQVLAGLITDEDRRRATGVPGLSRLPLLGRLFGVTSDTRNKSEIVMLITPHVVRNLVPAAVGALTIPSGVDALPGAAPLRLRDQARAGLAAGRGSAANLPAPTAGESTESPVTGLMLSATRQSRVGRTVSVTLANRGSDTARGELLFDPSLLQPASDAGATGTAGRWAFELVPQGQTALIFRVLAPAAGQTLSLQVRSDVPVEGEAQIAVAADAEASR